MDNFVTVVKSSTRTLSQGDKQPKAEERGDRRWKPYNTRSLERRAPTDWKEKKRVERLLSPLIKDGEKPSTSALTKRLLSTLSDESNPITHSDIYTRTDHVTSTATGHQRGERRVNQKSYLESRDQKLRAQLPQAPSVSGIEVLTGVRVYIDGYLEDTTDIEMKRIVTLAGGRMLQTPSKATHILTSQQLSGSKTHKVLSTRFKGNVYVVRPEWVTDSIEAGRRLSERTYSVIKDETNRNVADMLGAGPSRRVQ